MLRKTYQCFSVSLTLQRHCSYYPVIINGGHNSNFLSSYDTKSWILIRCCLIYQHHEFWKAWFVGFWIQVYIQGLSGNRNKINQSTASLLTVTYKIQTLKSKQTRCGQIYRIWTLGLPKPLAELNYWLTVTNMFVSYENEERKCLEGQKD